MALKRKHGESSHAQVRHRSDEGGVSQLGLRGATALCAALAHDSGGAGWLRCESELDAVPLDVLEERIDAWVAREKLRS